MSLLFTLVWKCEAQEFDVAVFTPVIVIGSQLVLCCCIVCICVCIIRRKRKRRAAIRQLKYAHKSQQQNPSSQSYRQLSESQPALGDQPQHVHSYGVTNVTPALNLTATGDDSTTESQAATPHVSEPASTPDCEGKLPKGDAPPAH